MICEIKILGREGERVARDPKKAAKEPQKQSIGLPRAVKATRARNKHAMQCNTI